MTDNHRSRLSFENLEDRCLLTGSPATNFIEVAKLSESNSAPDDNFGYSVSVFGEVAVVGVPWNDEAGADSGAVHLYEKLGSSWMEASELRASDAAAGDRFGSAVSVFGNVAIVGAPGDDEAGPLSGSAYVFERAGSEWTEVAKLTASDAAPLNRFADSVSVFADSIVVGAYGNDASGANSGAAYVFEKVGSIWTEVAKLTASDAAGGDLFGYSVSVAADSIVVGAYGNDDSGAKSGAAYVFEKMGSEWTEVAKLTASDAAAGDWFGYGVSVSNNVAILGAYQSNDGRGAAYVFERAGSEWTEVAKLTASDAARGDVFGLAVSISGNTVLIGANSKDGIASSSGAAYVFEKMGSEWTEVAKLSASDAVENGFFGYSVSISGGTAIAGAPGLYSDTRGGAAYLFESFEHPGGQNLLVDFTFDATVGLPDKIPMLPIPGPGTLVFRYLNPDLSPGGTTDFILEDGPNYVIAATGFVNGTTSSAPAYHGDYAIGAYERVFQMPVPRAIASPKLGVAGSVWSPAGPTGIDRLVVEYLPSQLTTPSSPPLMSITSGAEQRNSVSTSFVADTDGFLMIHSTAIGSGGGGHGIFVDGKGAGYTLHNGALTPEYYLLDVSAGSHTLMLKHEDELITDNNGTRSADVYFISGPTVGALAATPTGTKKVTLRWPRTISDGTYYVERASMPDGPFTLVEELPATKTSYVDSGPPLAPDTPYYYRIWALSDDMPSKYSSTVTATTLATAPPLGPQIINPVSGSFGSFVGSVDSLQVEFSEAIDDATFIPSDVIITGPGGYITGTSRSQIGSTNTYEVSFPARTIPGTYHVIIRSNLTDQAGHRMDQDGDPSNGNNWFVGTFALAAPTETQIVSLDRWWAYTGDEFTAELQVDVAQRGTYQLYMLIDQELGLDDWEFSDSPSVVVDGQSKLLSVNEVGRGLADLGLLEPGRHIIQVDGFHAPAEPVAQNVEFTLSRGDERETLNTIFIADRRGISSAVAANLGFEDGFGNSVDITGAQALVERFAPTLWFSAGENYPVPITVNEFMAGAVLRNSTQEVLTTPVSATPDAEAYIDLPGESIGAYVPSTMTPTVYASLVPDLAANRLAINYWFLFPYNDWRNHQERGNWGNNHEGDWEGITVFFEREDAAAAFKPVSVGYGQHERVKVPLLPLVIVDGGQLVDWPLAVGESSTSPNVFVALGSHASYFSARSSQTTIVGGLGFVTGLDEHRGNDFAHKLSPGSYSVELLGRTPELASTPDAWGLFPGSWGQPDLPGGQIVLPLRGLSPTAGLRLIYGDDGPRGPVFQESGFAPGTRWMDPWEWIGSFDHVDELGEAFASTYEQIKLQDLEALAQEHHAKPAFGVTLGADVSQLAAWLGGPPVEVVEEIVDALGGDLASASLTIYVDIADLLGKTNDSEDGGWVTVWAEVGVSFFDFDFGSAGPLDPPFSVGAGIVPIEVPSGLLNEDPGLGGSVSFLNGNLAGISKAFLGEVDLFTDPGFTGDWSGFSIGTLAPAASTSLLEASYNFATFEVELPVLLDTFSVLADGLANQLLFGPLALQPPSTTTASLADVVSAIAGLLTDVSWIRPATSLPDPDAIATDAAVVAIAQESVGDDSLGQDALSDAALRIRFARSLGDRDLDRTRKLPPMSSPRGGPLSPRGRATLDVQPVQFEEERGSALSRRRIQQQRRASQDEPWDLLEVAVDDTPDSREATLLANLPQLARLAKRGT